MKKMEPLIGAHISIEGGIGKALLTGYEIGCEAIQLFLKSNINKY